MPPLNDVAYAKGRLAERLYISRTFVLGVRDSQDYGQHARYVWKVFDEQSASDELDPSTDMEWTEYVVHTTPAGRK